MESRCGVCDGRAFRVTIDEEEATQRACLACGTAAFTRSQQLSRNQVTASWLGIQSIEPK